MFGIIVIRKRNNLLKRLTRYCIWDSAFCKTSIRFYCWALKFGKIIGNRNSKHEKSPIALTETECLFSAFYILASLSNTGNLRLSFQLLRTSQPHVYQTKYWFWLKETVPRNGKYLTNKIINKISFYDIEWLFNGVISMNS